MPQWFNTAGTCKADIHYMLPPTERLPNLLPLIAQQNYFVIHAPRQVGKTTAMLALAQQLTQSGQFPQSIGLIGMRDVRDYKVKSGGSDRLNTASP